MRGPYKYPYVPLHTHMSEGELALWKKFCMANPGKYKIVYFDWEVGGVRPSLEELADYAEKNRQYLGRYKIDVVVEAEDHFCVIEVKREATTKALGEIWLYDDLFRAQEQPKKPVRTMVLTDVEMPDIRRILEADDVELVVI